MRSRTLEAPAVGGRLSRGLSQISPFTEVLAVVLALIAVCCCSTLVEDFSEAARLGIARARVLRVRGWRACAGHNARGPQRPPGRDRLPAASGG